VARDVHPPALFHRGSRSDGRNSSGGEVTMVEPSKGKPPITPDSIVNLDQ